MAEDSMGGLGQEAKTTLPTQARGDWTQLGGAARSQWGFLGHEKGPDLKTERGGTSLVVQWLRLCAPHAGGPGLIPGQGARSRMPQLRTRAAK